MSKESKEIFKQQLIFKKQESRNKRLRDKKVAKWVEPNAYKRQLKKIVQSIIKQYINITESIYPLLEEWNKEVKELKGDIQTPPVKVYFDDKELEPVTVKDSWEEELENINEQEYEVLFEKNKSYLKETLLSMGVLISTFNRNQWYKIVQGQFDFTPFTYEGFERSFLNAWVNRNVSLIKGLTEEYRKKIMDTIISSYQKGISVNELKQNLSKINKTFSNYRSELIAKDQINKINAQLSQLRQQNAGVETYIWRTSNDERVRTTHSNMNGKLCRWDDATVYSTDNGRTWIKRRSDMPIAHPGDEVNCRCFGEPNFKPLVREVNSTQETLIG